MAQAQARIPALIAYQAQPARDLEALDRLAQWMHRYTPLVTVDPPDGIWLDTTGCDHLHGGEQAMLSDLMHRFAEAGYAVRAAVSDTPGCSHAVARHGPDPLAIVPAGPSALSNALFDLPVDALRLEPLQRDVAHRIGFERIGDVVSQMSRLGQTGTGVGRGPVAYRVGAELFTRVDQAFGRLFEPLTPQLVADRITHTLAFAEPLIGRDGLEAAVAVLIGRACGDLERTGEGALGLDLLFEAMDQSSQALRIGTSHPTRARAHLERMLLDGLETIEAERGIEAMRLVVSASARLADTQLGIGTDEPSRVMVAELVDRLAARSIMVWRGHVDPNQPPETSVVEDMANDIGRDRAKHDAILPPRPPRLLDPPQPVDVIGLLPDYPPVQFVWRRQRHRIRRADGPERLYRRRPFSPDAGVWMIRDYFSVEDEAGRRFWLVRQGDGVNLDTGNLAWYLHGLF